MGPYTKRNDSTVIDDGWTIWDGDHVVIAHLQTEGMVDALLFLLLSGCRERPPSYPEGEPLDCEEEPG